MCFGCPVSIRLADLRIELRPLSGGDEREVREAHREMESENFAFAPGLTAETDWAAYCEWIEQQRAGLTSHLDGFRRLF